jgi:hypothetical protein
MKAYGGVDAWIHIFLTSALAGGEWPASRPYSFDWRLGGPQSRSGRGEIKILDPTGTRTPAPRSSQPLVSRYTDCYPGSYIYCTVLAVLVTFTGYTTQLVTLFYCRLC